MSITGQPGHPQPGLELPELFSGPHSGTFFCTKFAAFPGNCSNNVDPADQTKIVAFRRNVSNNVDKNPDLAFLAKSSGSSRPGWGFLAPAWGFGAKFGPDLIFKLGPKHQKWPEMGPESTVRAETWSRSMPGPLRSLWDGSNPLQGAVPGEKSKEVCPSRPRFWYLTVTRQWLTAE